MPRQERLQHHVPIFGILLLFLGIVFLLQSLGILPWGLWEMLWRFWPVLIIVFGLNLLLSHRNPWLVGLLVLALLLACLGVALWQYGPSALGRVTRSYSGPLAGLESAQRDFNNAENLIELEVDCNIGLNKVMRSKLKVIWLA